GFDQLVELILIADGGELRPWLRSATSDEQVGGAFRLDKVDNARPERHFATIRSRPSIEKRRKKERRGREDFTANYRARGSHRTLEQEVNQYQAKRLNEVGNEEQRSEAHDRGLAAAGECGGRDSRIHLRAHKRRITPA